MIDFIAGGSTPEAVAEFRPSADAQRRASELLEKCNAGTLTHEEEAELDLFVELERIMQLARVRARKLLAARG